MPEEKTTKILLLEDEGEFTEILQIYLEANGCSVTCVGNGLDGLKLVMKEDFDLILCDMMMPNLPGDMFYLAVERTKPQLCKRFIFMTGYKGDFKIEEFIRRVEGIMLWKPFQLHELMDTIKSVLQVVDAK